MQWQVICRQGEEYERQLSIDMAYDSLHFFRKTLRVREFTTDQEKIALSVINNKCTAVQAAHGVGKTFIEACLALWFLMTHRNSIVITTAPTERQVREILWSEINNLIVKSGLFIGGKDRLTGYAFGPRWFATGITTIAGNDEDSAVRFQGYHANHILVIVDEAVGIQPAIWEAIDGITSSKEAKILAVANPATPNCVFKEKIDSRTWNVLKVSALNHPNVLQKKEIIPGAVSYEWIKDKIKMWCKEITNDQLLITNDNIFEFGGKHYVPNNLFKWKVLGEFPEESTDTLIPRTAVQSAVQRGKKCTESECNECMESEYGEKNSSYSIHSNHSTHSTHSTNCFMSIDVARFGSDSSVIALNRDNFITHYTFYNLDTAKLTGEAINLIKKYKPAKVGVDCDGIGAGVYDNLNEALSSEVIDTELIEIHGGANAVSSLSSLGSLSSLSRKKDDEFMNLRAQIYWLLKEDIETLAIQPDEGNEIEIGLSSIKYFFNTKGKIQIESKDDIRKRLGRSPDAEDAIAYVNFLKYTTASGYSSSEFYEESDEYRNVTDTIGIH